MSQHTETAAKRRASESKVCPFTGAEFLESLRDSREVWIYGERVKDVTTHPAFRNSARMLARMYDALHDPARQNILTTSTDTGNGSFHAYVFQGSAEHRGTGRKSRRDRRMGAYRVWLDGTFPGLQS